MNAKDFFDKVAEMRDAQRRFYNTRSYPAMQRAKALEKEIDAEIKRVRDKVKKQERTLFDL